MIYTIDNKVPDFLLNPKYRVIRHLLLQLMIILITVNILWDVPDEMITTSERLIAWFFYYLMLLLMVYLNIYVLAPRLLMKNKLLSYLTGVVLSITGIIISIGLLQTLIDDGNAIDQEVDTGRVVLGIVSSALAMGLLIAGTSALLLFKQWIGYNKRISELEANTLQSELKHLKDQINPHFLFNMLNNANVLVKKRPEEASEMLFKLEDLLRYQINDSTKEKVWLTSEIHFLNDFLNLEKIRRDKFDYVISKEGVLNGIELPPLLFIPFVENAVKHNPDSENKSYVRLYFKMINNKLIFVCENSKPVAVAEKKGAGGLGLKNIRRRLELLFPESHELGIDEDDSHFTVTLKLEL